MSFKQEFPTVSFDKEQGIFEISGNSHPENPGLFYQPIIDEISEYILNPQNTTTVNIKLSYFNTASSRQIMIMLLEFKKIQIKNKELIVNWFYSAKDEDMLEFGEDFSDVSAIKFNYREY